MENSSGVLIPSLTLPPDKSGGYAKETPLEFFNRPYLEDIYCDIHQKFFYLSVRNRFNEEFNSLGVVDVIVKC